MLSAPEVGEKVVNRTQLKKDSARYSLLSTGREIFFITHVILDHKGACDTKTIKDHALNRGLPAGSIFSTHEILISTCSNHFRVRIKKKRGH